MSDENPTPALFDHTKRVYEEMLKRSTKQTAPVSEVNSLTVVANARGANTAEVQVYEGHLTTLFSELSIANPYYTKIRDALVGQNCMVQLRRGGGSALSKWIMLSPPTEEGFREIMDRKSAPKGQVKILEQQIRGLTKIVNEVVDRLERLEAKA